MTTHRTSTPIRLLLATALSAALAFLASASARAQDACGSAINDCFTTNLLAGGCSNPVCCELTCSVEPACCEVAWDDLCVAIATKYCSDCGLVPESCFEPHPTPSCNNGAVCEFVCLAAGYEYCCDTEWDAACVRKARELTDECGEPATGSCLAVHENPNCKDRACCEQVCDIDPNCCSVTWDQVCVDWASRLCFTCGNQLAGSCCHQHDGPFCDDPVCCEAVCAIDPFCCDTRWDSLCARIATEGINGQPVCVLPLCLCGRTIPGFQTSCRVVHESPGCDDRVCCDLVCYVDEFCCAAEWDFTCVQMALANCALSPDPAANAACNAATGSCFVASTLPGCSDRNCCAEVCISDPTCCSLKWDVNCVNLAAVRCNDCGDLDAGSCFWPHGTPGCIDRECCTLVCNALDPTCCVVSWDFLCVVTAAAACTDGIACGSPETRPCSVASAIPACEDQECCQIGCSFDPTCCSRAWDETCAVNAIYLCDLSFPNCPSSGSPLALHGPGCADALCCSAVCSVDPFCCTQQWSAACVQVAKAVCVTFGGCPGSGPCDAVHAEPGCSEPTCCAVVCAADPFCCEQSWSAGCVARARAVCDADNAPASCPCVGSCFEAHENPGCEDEICCAGVCAQDPLCCTEEWDQGCAALARSICCTTPRCGNNCAGSCLESHQSPYCDDPACCEAVCRFDDYCCTVRWDQSCVISARETCLGGCGMPVSGNCYAEHDTPGCSDGSCCASVCAAEEFEYCCTVRWDEDCAARASDLCKDERPECGDVGLPGCNLAHQGPACADADCCNEVCTADPFCCDSQWDETCAQSIYEFKRCERYRAECGGECAGSCCEPHRGPWCNDQGCCEAVCRADIFCCTTEWDEFCAATANLSTECRKACPDPACGTPEAGSCCFPHDTANCSDLNCCEEVCGIDPYCCDVVWDVTCAAIARSECGDLCEPEAFCGAPGTGSCCNEHPTPFCSDAQCCTFVCTFDESCCFDSWDATCVKFASALCPGCQ